MSEASLGILHNYALVVASLKHHGNAYNANSLRNQRNSGANALLEGLRREKTTEGSTPFPTEGSRTSGKTPPSIWLS